MKIEMRQMKVGWHKTGKKEGKKQERETNEQNLFDNSIVRLNSL